MIEIKRTNSNDPDFVSLTKELDKELRSRYNDYQDFLEEFNYVENLPTAVVAYEYNSPVGCCCFKHFDKESAELKRMYVLPEARSKGIAGKMLDALEAWAKESGYSAVILETGKLQPEAIHLYQKKGYTITANYGQYVGMALSVCMKKQIFK